VHEKIRELSMQAGKRVKEEGLDNNLLELIAEDPDFHVSMDDLQKYMDPSKYTGCAAHQVDRFLQEVIQPILDANAELLGEKAEITV
jgi:adenylosuccinate lyase